MVRKYGIGTRLLFSWKKALTLQTSPGPTFLPVTLVDGANEPAGPASIAAPAPVIVERTAPGIEVELIGGRRVRFERDVDPETVRRLVSLLEGEAP